VYGALFDNAVPEQVEGFTMDDPEERERIRACWPAGEDAAKQASRVPSGATTAKRSS